MKIVHISSTPLAGHPIKLVRAINEFSQHSARFIDLGHGVKGYGNRVYDSDLVVGRDDDEIREVLSSAELIHLHQTIELSYSVCGIRISDLIENGVKVVRQFASQPSHFDTYAGEDVVETKFKNESVLHLVVAQYHERYYRWAYEVPLIVYPYDRDLDEESAFKRDAVRIVYSPSNQMTFAESRWGSKGYDATLEVLKKIEEKKDVEICIVYDVSHREVMKEKARADIIIDEFVTGTFHTSALEGLALGKTTISYVDQRTCSTLSRVAGSGDVPFVMPRNKQELEKILIKLVDDKDLLHKIGEASLSWFKRNYHPSKLIKNYIRIYENIDLLKVKNLEDFSIGEYFLNVEQFDLLQEVTNENEA